MIWPQVRCWEVQDNGQTVPKAQQMHTGPVLDVCWSDVSLIVSDRVVSARQQMSRRIIYDVLHCLTRMGAKSSLLPVIRLPRCGILTAIKQCRLHRLDASLKFQYMVHNDETEGSNASHRFSLQHDGPIKAIHWIKAPNYSCIMTGSWDKTLKVLKPLVIENAQYAQTMQDFMSQFK